MVAFIAASESSYITGAIKTEIGCHTFGATSITAEAPNRRIQSAAFVPSMDLSTSSVLT